MIFDTHAHLNFKDYDEDRKELLQKTLDKGVGMINVGADLKTSKKAVEIAQKYENVYATAGVHPSHANDKLELDILIELAQDENLPLVLHCRKAHSDMLSLISEKDIKGVVHCFSGDWETAKRYLDLDLYLGFNGIIYKNPYSKDVIQKISLSKMIVETDCPFLLPPQAEGGRNEPINVRYIIKEIANIKNIKEIEVEKQTTKNAENLFKLDNS